MSRISALRKRTVSAVAAAALTLGTVIPAAKLMIPLRSDAGEQLGQTNFDDGVGLPWHIVESAPGEMDFAIEDGVYSVTIVNPGGASRGGERSLGLPVPS